LRAPLSLSLSLSLSAGAQSLFLESQGDDEARADRLQDDPHRVHRLDLQIELGHRGAKNGDARAGDAGHLVDPHGGHQPQRGQAPQDEEPHEACVQKEGADERRVGVQAKRVRERRVVQAKWQVVRARDMNRWYLSGFTSKFRSITTLGTRRNCTPGRTRGGGVGVGEGAPWARERARA